MPQYLELDRHLTESKLGARGRNSWTMLVCCGAMVLHEHCGAVVAIVVEKVETRFMADVDE